jgi:hypothetical protein
MKTALARAFPATRFHLRFPFYAPISISHVDGTTSSGRGLSATFIEFHGHWSEVESRVLCFRLERGYGLI